MKIIWQPNPLYTKIELDDHDKEILKLKIRIKELETGSSLVRSYIGEKLFDLERAREHSARLEKDRLNARVELLLGYYLEEIDDPHCGDCTCTAMSCSKCELEDLLGIDTTEGRDKYTLYPINNAFSKSNDGSVSIEDALQKLKDYAISEKKKDGVSDEVLARWKSQYSRSALWLEQYRDKHFPIKE